MPHPFLLKTGNGNMTTFVHPGPSGSVGQDCNWQDFFGEPRGPIAQNAYSAFPRETLHLPEVYKVRGVNPLKPPVVFSCLFFLANST